MLTLDKIYNAANTLSKVVRKTDMIPSQYINPESKIFLKAENLQVTGSFKVRGAYNKISLLSEAEKKKGVIACSAGNHAQGVALAAAHSRINALICIPAGAPISKVETTRSYGAEVRLVKGVYDDAYKEACELQKKSGAIFIHPFNDEDVIAGQGTIGLEMLDQLPDADIVIVPVGGGGLISGVAYAIKSLKPSCKVYGVQASGAPSMKQALENKKVESLESVSTFADGIAVKCPGNLTYGYCSKYVDGIVTVTDDEIATAILTLIEKQKLVAEGAGAASVAAAMFNKVDIKGKKVICLVSGGNIDVTILSRVINRGLIKEGRLGELLIDMADKPGQIMAISNIIASHGGNVVSVHHDRNAQAIGINFCILSICIETRNQSHLEEIRKAVTDAGYNIH